MKQNQQPQRKEKIIAELKSLLKFLIGFFIFATLFFQPFNIPSGSMIPNLLIGDFVVVNKYAYGYTRYNIPFLGSYIPFFKGRILPKDPKPGDIAVFHNPLDNKKDYVKRVIAVAGDRVQMINGLLHINGVECPIKRIDDFPYEETESNQVILTPQFEETLPNGFKHTYIKHFPFGKARRFDHNPSYSSDNTPEYTVPENHFFIIGDNRDGSLDSRFMNNKIGFISNDHLFGKLEFVFYSTSAKWYQPLKWISGTRLSRIFIRPH